VKCVLLPQIDYALPFICPNNKEYNLLNRIYYRPLNKYLAIPASVHRAGFAVYNSAPILQVQRDYSLLTLFDNIYSLGKCDNNLPQRYAIVNGKFPIYNLICNLFSKEALIAHRNLISAKFNNYDKTIFKTYNDLFLRFAFICYQWNIINYIPNKSQLTDLTYHIDLKSIINKNFYTQSIIHWLCENKNIRSYYNNYSYSGPKGEFLPQFYGIQLNSINSYDDIVNISMSTHKECYPCLNIVERRQAIIMSRLLLNRSYLNSVYNFHNKSPNKVIASLCYNCVNIRSEPETVEHAICDCSSYSYQRQILRNKLHSAILDFRRINYYNNLFVHDNHIFMQFVLGSIPAFQFHNCNFKLYSNLLRDTLIFIEHIAHNRNV
jgi:hypothetical protein